MATSTSNHSLAVQTRPKTGSTSVRALRREGKVPGILFGHGTAPLPIVLQATELGTLLNAGGKAHLLSITIDGNTKDTVLLREVQRDPVSHHVIHADLQRVSASESIHATLPVVAVGVAEGVRHGGVRDIVTHQLEIQGPANQLPEHIEIDVTALKVHDHISAADVKLPAQFKMLTPPETIVITIAASRTAVEAETTAPATGAAPAATTPAS